DAPPDEPEGAAVPEGEHRVPPLRVARARTSRAAALARDRDVREPDRQGAARVVGSATDGFDARDPRRPRAGRRRRPPTRPAPVGPGRALVPADGDDPVARGAAADRREALPRAGRQARTREAGGAPGRAGRTDPRTDDVPLPIRPACPRPPAHGDAV